MTLDQEYAQYQGQSVLVPGADPADRGQCFMWFDYVLHDVYGQPYFFSNGAIDIWDAPGVLLDTFDKIPYDPNMMIQKGDIVVYGTGVGSDFGHVDIAAQDGIGASYVGYDSNWGHNLTVHTVNHNDAYNQYILGVLRLKGENMPDVATADDVNLLTVGMSDLQIDANPNFKNNEGRPLRDVMKEVLNYPTSVDFRLRAQAYDGLQAQIADLKAQLADNTAPAAILAPGNYQVK